MGVKHKTRDTIKVNPNVGLVAPSDSPQPSQRRRRQIQVADLLRLNVNDLKGPIANTNEGLTKDLERWTQKTARPRSPQSYLVVHSNQQSPVTEVRTVDSNLGMIQNQSVSIQSKAGITIHDHHGITGRKIETLRVNQITSTLHASPFTRVAEIQDQSQRFG